MINELYDTDRLSHVSTPLTEKILKLLGFRRLENSLYAKDILLTPVRHVTLNLKQYPFVRGGRSGYYYKAFRITTYTTRKPDVVFYWKKCDALSYKEQLIALLEYLETIV